MPERILPGLGLRGFYDPGQTDWGTPLSEDLRRLSALVQARAVSRSASLPGTADPGDIAIVPPGAAEHAHALAIWDGPAGAEDWVFLSPLPGWRVFVADEGSFAWFNGTAWSAEASGGGGGATPFQGVLTRMTATHVHATLNAWEAIAWDAVSYDSLGFWSAGTPQRLTIPAGVPRVRLKAGLKVDASDTMPASNALSIRKNGATSVAEGTIRTEGFNNAATTIATPVLSVAEGDTFELAYWVGSSFATGTTATFLALEVVEATGLTTSLKDLGDTDTTTTPPADGDTLVWDAGKGRWRPGPPLIASKCLVTLPGAQAITANTWTRINFSTEFYDVGDDFDAASSFVFTAPKTGYYLAVISFVHQDTAGTPTLMRGGFGINGGSPANYNRGVVPNPVSLTSQLEFTTILPLNAGDTVAGMVYLQGVGAAIPGPNLARMTIAWHP